MQAVGTKSSDHIANLQGIKLENRLLGFLWERQLAANAEIFGTANRGKMPLPQFNKR
jgi:hypothetical protein